MNFNASGSRYRPAFLSVSYFSFGILLQVFLWNFPIGILQFKFSLWTFPISLHFLERPIIPLPLSLFSSHDFNLASHFTSFPAHPFISLQLRFVSHNFQQLLFVPVLRLPSLSALAFSCMLVWFLSSALFIFVQFRHFQ